MHDNLGYSNKRFISVSSLFLLFWFFRWLLLPSQHDQSTMSLSSSACPMMLCVRDRLLNLHQNLSLSLFQKAWQGLAERIDNFLYQDVSNKKSPKTPTIKTTQHL